MTENQDTNVTDPESWFLIIFAVALFLASWLVANVEIGESVTWVSALFIIFLAVPSYYYTCRWLGLKQGLILILILSILPIIVEAIGISSGLPYGPFHYTDQMGFKFAGLVPWSVSFAFAPLVLGSLTIASQFTQKLKFMVPISALILVAVDLVLDPAAVLLNIWVWEVPGIYYGIPLTNYTGWFMTAILASAMVLGIVSNSKQPSDKIPSKVASSLFLSASFWTGYCFWTGLVIPIIVGVAVVFLIFYIISQS